MGVKYGQGSRRETSNEKFAFCYNEASLGNGAVRCILALLAKRIELTEKYSMSDAEQWIQTLQLRPHPEGGWFREVYRSEETISPQGLPRRFSGERHFSTAIYFLLNEKEFSAFHRIKQDEIWHFYDGNALTIHMIDPSGNYSAVKLGRNPSEGESLLVVVKAGWLFGATVNGENSFGLVGCTVAPGFDFDDFEMPSRAELLDQYPQHKEIIEGLTTLR
jgi:predicted cupin superfamily sugar epimerase